jgi:hypothetical protein
MYHPCASLLLHEAYLACKETSLPRLISIAVWI